MASLKYDVFPKWQILYANVTHVGLVYIDLNQEICFLILLKIAGLMLKKAAIWY